MKVYPYIIKHQLQKLWQKTLLRVALAPQHLKPQQCYVLYREKGPILCSVYTWCFYDTLPDQICFIGNKDDRALLQHTWHPAVFIQYNTSQPVRRIKSKQIRLHTRHCTVHIIILTNIFFNLYTNWSWTHDPCSFLKWSLL